MSSVQFILKITFFSCIACLLACCYTGKTKEVKAGFEYERFKDSLLKNSKTDTTEQANFFDKPVFRPGEDSLNTLLIKLDTLMYREAHLMLHLDTMKKGLKKEPGFSEEEKAIIRENISVLDSFLAIKKMVDSGKCKGPECIVYAEIDKSKQLMYLYILGEVKDTFKVSTGKGKKYETPAMDLRPQGPVLTKYTSRKFPGGNYMGLGNMPYAVFLRNGYAIHGTTPGNFSKLGSRASHGCIRLHPDNAKIFNALVKTVGLQQTWVSIKDSIP
jgi:hypothetical protein